MNDRYVQPTHKAPRFTCPHCGAFAGMTWDVFLRGDRKLMDSPLIAEDNQMHWQVSRCMSCKSDAIWLRQGVSFGIEDLLGDYQLVYPSALLGQPASADMPSDVRPDYDEARTVAAQSPRSAAALLRLCVQKLCKHFGESGDNINTDIKNLVAQGRLTPLAQRAMDTIRIVGNNAVHPLEMSVDEIKSTVPALFAVIGFIVEDMITRPKLVNETYLTTPQRTRDAVAHRDGQA